MTTYLRFSPRLFPASWWTCWYWTWGRSGGGRDVGSAGASGNGASDSTFRWGVTFGSNRRPVVGLFLLPGNEGRDGLGVQVGQWNGETAKDGVVSDSVCNPLILSLQRSRDLAGGGELIGRRSVLQHLEEEVTCAAWAYLMQPTWSSGLLWSRESPPQGTDRTRCSPTWTRTAWRSGRRPCRGRGESWRRRRRSSAWGQPALGGGRCCRPVLGGARPVPPLPLYLADADVDVSSARLAGQDCPPLPPVLPGWGRRASHRLCLSGPPLHQKTCRDPRLPSRRLPAQPTPPPPPHATALPQLQICNCINHKRVYTTIVFFHQVCHHCISVWSSTVPFCT